MQKYELIFPDKGEPNDEAIRRHGFEPGHPDFKYMLIEFVTTPFVTPLVTPEEGRHGRA